MVSTEQICRHPSTELWHDKYRQTFNKLDALCHWVISGEEEGMRDNWDRKITKERHAARCVRLLEMASHLPHAFLVNYFDIQKQNKPGNDPPKTVPVQINWWSSSHLWNQKFGQGASCMYLCVCVTKKAVCMRVIFRFLPYGVRCDNQCGSKMASKSCSVLFWGIHLYDHNILHSCARRYWHIVLFCCIRPSFWNKLESIMFHQRQLKKHFQITLIRSHLSTLL